MRRMLLVSSVAIAAAAVGVGAAIVSVTSHAQAARTSHVAAVPGDSTRLILRFTSTTTKSAYVDNAPKGLSAGDMLTQHSVWTEHGTKAGVMALTAAVTLRTSAQTGEVMYTAVAKVKDGQIVLSGTFDIVPQNQTFRAAVTGGTGAYRNAHGYAIFKQVSGIKTLVTLYVQR